MTNECLESFLNEIIYGSNTPQRVYIEKIFFLNLNEYRFMFENLSRRKVQVLVPI